MSYPTRTAFHLHKDTGDVIPCQSDKADYAPIRLVYPNFRIGHCLPNQLHVTLPISGRYERMRLKI